MILSKFLVELSAHPRANYTAKHTKRLLRQFRNVLGMIGLSDPFPDMDFSKVHVHIISENTVDSSYLEAQVRGACQVVWYEMMEVSSPEEFCKIGNGHLCVDVVNFDNESNAILSFIGDCTMIIDKNHNDQVSHAACMSGITEIVPESRFRTEFDRYLERLVLKQLYLRAGLLQALLRLNVYILNDLNQRMEMRMTEEMSKRHEQGDTIPKLWGKARYDALLNIFQGIFGEYSSAIKLQVLEGTILTNNGNAEELAREFENFLNNFQDLIERVERERKQIIHLYGRFVGMFLRSGVPDEERPKGPYHLQLDQRTAQEILGVRGVISCGFQFSVLHVYFDPRMSNEERKKAEIMLQDVMRWNKIDHFVFSSGRFENFSRREEQRMYVVRQYFTRTRSLEGVFPRRPLRKRDR